MQSYKGCDLLVKSDMEPKEIPETSGTLARSSGVSQTTVCQLAREGLLDFVVTANGFRLFVAGQAPRVRKLVAERMVKARRRA